MRFSCRVTLSRIEEWAGESEPVASCRSNNYIVRNRVTGASRGVNEFSHGSEERDPDKSIADAMSHVVPNATKPGASTLDRELLGRGVVSLGA